MHWFTSSRRLMGYLVAAAIGVLVGAGSYAVASAGTNAIHACADKRTGALRLAKSCTRHERAVSWSKTGPAGASATKLFVLDDIDGNVVRSSGGVTVSQQSTDNNSGTVSRTVTFPSDVSKCVAVASPSIDNGSATPIGPLETSINGHTVTVREPILRGGILLPFALAVFC